MSQEDVELVARSLREFSATHRPSGLVAPDAVWDVSAFSGWPDVKEYRGDDGFMEFFAKWTEAYDAWDMAVEDLVDAGDDRVVAVIEQRGRLKDSDSWLELRFAVVYTIRDGQIQRRQLFVPPEEAFKAAGLRV